MTTEPCEVAHLAERGEPDRSPALLLPPDAWPHLDQLVTEDDTPVDNIFSEKQQRLLTETLYTSWAGPGSGMPFLALANVGVFYAAEAPPLVPDVLLSVGVQAPPDVWKKTNRSYFIASYGKPPDVVVEIVSNRKGDEAGSKFADYASLRVPYYVIFDPSRRLKQGVLRVYQLKGARYAPLPAGKLAGVELELVLWNGSFADLPATWLRWRDRTGTLLATGQEQRQRAEQERQRAEQEQLRTERERQRA
ncbi:MAG: Uma2 family endonuclease, partial [Chloroflexaceae bacterium]|nr:Uma2 family endonuclease [Chloroflexaceae bacterium]